MNGLDLIRSTPGAGVVEVIQHHGRSGTREIVLSGLYRQGLPIVSSILAWSRGMAGTGAGWVW